MLGACGRSMPTRYLTLDAVAAGAPLATAPVAPIAPVQLTAVHVPAVLDRPEVVTVAAPNRLTIDDNERWGAPLAQMMRGTLAQDLLARLPAGSFVVPDAPAPPQTRALVVTVLDLKAQASGTLTLQAEWTLLAGSPGSPEGPGRPAQRQQVTLSADYSAADSVAQAAALSRVLGELADRIAAALLAQ